MPPTDFVPDEGKRRMQRNKNLKKGGGQGGVGSCGLDSVLAKK